MPERLNRKFLSRGKDAEERRSYSIYRCVYHFNAFYLLVRNFIAEKSAGYQKEPLQFKQEIVMNNIFVGAVIGVAAWFCYFQFVDWLLMSFQGLKYFEFIRSVF